MTLTGKMRDIYAEVFRASDPRPSRFTADGAYGAWAARADAWAKSGENIFDLRWC